MSILACSITSGKPPGCQWLSPRNQLPAPVDRPGAARAALYHDLSARENLQFSGRLYRHAGRPAGRRVETVLAAISLADRADDRAGTFSGGMQRRLNLGIGLVHEPKLLLLDEPTTGVDPQSRNHIFEEIRRVNREGMTVIYTSHYMEEVEALCTRIGVMDHGRVIASDTLTGLLRQMDGLLRCRFAEVSEGLRVRLGQTPDVRVIRKWASDGHCRCPTALIKS